MICRASCVGTIDHPILWVLFSTQYCAKPPRGISASTNELRLWFNNSLVQTAASPSHTPPFVFAVVSVISCSHNNTPLQTAPDIPPSVADYCPPRSGAISRTVSKQLSWADYLAPWTSLLQSRTTSSASLPQKSERQTPKHPNTFLDQSVRHLLAISDDILCEDHHEFNLLHTSQKAPIWVELTAPE